MERGLVLVSEDRRRDQAFLTRAVRENLTATVLPRLLRVPLGRLDLDRERGDAASAATTFRVQHPGLEAFMLALSGGNQQKAIIARWLQTEPLVCILDEPTKGVDIGARAEMHRLIRERAEAGVAFLLISSDLPELLDLADRVLVLHKGRIAGELPRAQAEPHGILAMASTGRADMTVRRRRISRSAAQVWSLVAVLLLVSIGFSSLTDRFADLDNLRNVLLQAAPTTIGAIGMTFVIAARGIDLSIGSIANLAIAIAIAAAGTRAEAELTTDTVWLVYPVALLAGVLLGALNAVAIVSLRLSALITTLGTLTLYRGLGLHVTSASLIAVRGPVLGFGRTLVFGVGLPVWAALLFAVIGWVVLSQTPAGRQILALGGSPRSAVETGLRTGRLLVLAYAISGLCGAIAGLIMVGRVGMVNPDLGFGMEFTVITAVVLGGTSLFGGRASILGAVLGSLLLATIDNGMTLIGANPYSYDVVRGVILLAAVSADAISAYLRGRRSPVIAELRL